MEHPGKVTRNASSFAALALAFASLGDAFLYPFLPVNFQLVGVPVGWVGLILSINRFVRIAANLMMVHAFAKYGLRTIVIAAAILAIASTLGYAFATTLIAWLLLRIMWGLSFSALRIGTVGYALEQQRKGFALGVSRSLQELGPMLSLFLAPVFLKFLDSRAIFILLSLLSIPALFFAWKLPRGEDRTEIPKSKPFFRWPSTLNSITLISSILVDGIIVVALGILFLHHYDEITLIGATTLAAFYLGYRRICLVLFAPAGGWAADRVGIDRIFNISIVFVVLGLIVILLGWIGTGAVLVFTFYGIHVAITPGSVAKGDHYLGAVSENATWRDIGGGVGAFIGGFTISSSYLDGILLIGIIVLIFLILVHLKATQHVFKLFYLWR
jgi:MFS family permease